MCRYIASHNICLYVMSQPVCGSTLPTPGFESLRRTAAPLSCFTAVRIISRLAGAVRTDVGRHLCCAALSSAFLCCACSLMTRTFVAAPIY